MPSKRTQSLLAPFTINGHAHVSRDKVMRRYPRLVAHLICESLGYFTPEAAAAALLAAREGGRSYCEWYDHMTGIRLRQWDETRQGPKPDYNTVIAQVTRDVVAAAFKHRRGHRGYMSDYEHARALVSQVAGGGRGPEFASWF